MAANPKRRKRTTRKRTRRYTRRRRTRRYRRNPGLRIGGLAFPPMTRIASGVAGVTAMRVVPDWINRVLPMVPTVGPAGLAVKALTAVLLGQAAQMLMRSKQIGQDVAFGGLIGVADEAVQMYLLPAVGVGASLEAYLDPTMGQYLSPGATVAELPEYDVAIDTAPELPSRLDANQRL